MPFSSGFVPHYESEASCIFFIVKISFYTCETENGFSYKKVCTEPCLQGSEMAYSITIPILFRESNI